MTCPGCGCKHEGRHTNRDCPVIHNRAIVARSWYGILSVASDPKKSYLITNTDGDALLFRLEQDAFDWAKENVAGLWQTFRI